MNYIFQRKNINLLSFVGILIIIFISYISYQQIKHLINASNWVVHTHEVVEVIDEILIDINFAESRQRGYLLTNDKNYIKNYDNAIKAAHENVARLKYLTNDNPANRERVQYLEALLTQRIRLLNEVLQVNVSQGITAAIHLIQKSEGKTISDKILDVGHNIIEEEKNLLLLRTNHVNDTAFKTTIFELIGFLISICLLVLSLLLLNHQLLYRFRIEKKLEKSEENFKHLAYYDTLTGLPNRLLLINIMEEILINNIENKSIAFLLIDIDNFKNINDSLGHETGDILLTSFATMLKKSTREHDIIARLAGDEFAIVLTEIDNIQDIISVAKKILSRCIEAITISHHKVFITVSIGISLYPNNGTDTKSLMKNAEIAMYRAKELGKNNFQFCTSDMAIQVEKRALLDYHLHQALKRNEFVLFYQPKISLKDEKIRGVEVLIRWARPDEGLLSPEHFIPLAESNGLIVPIGEWMLKTACQQAKKWQAEGLPLLNIAINVSSRQFIISDFVKIVEKIIKEVDFDPAFLELEITESILMENSLNNIASLHALENMGIKITIDDFGTGFSSLSYLRLFTIDKLKIDKSFVNEINTVDQHASIINAIIIMAHSLNIKVVAEGVETSVQVEYLKLANCDEVQGYYYSHPLTANEIHDYLEQLKQ